ncbi:MAG TPA: hypothetical protein VEW46_22525, partial [Pyrinomonadaceae bacterium]|nr:hypothetical protein [Pyrinomonadaceae bacterium]
MPNKKKAAAKKSAKRTGAKKAVRLPEAPEIPAATSTIPEPVLEFLKHTSVPEGFVRSQRLTLSDLRKKVVELNLKSTVPLEQLLESANRIKPSVDPVEKLPEDVKASVPAMKPAVRRFHGIKVPLYWFPFPWLSSACADRFGYMSSPLIRAATRLPFSTASQALLRRLGDMMGDAGRDPNPGSHNPADPGVSSIPAGFTYFGQFVDHDITFDVSSTLDAATDANTINNMRSPSLDLDSVYGRGPALDPFLYAFPASGPSTAIKLQRGANSPVGPGGPSNNGNPTGMVQQTNWDVPRISGTNTAAIGDPRNDENLIIVQFQHAMLRFHNAVVDLLLAAAFAGDIFAEAKR